MKIKIPKQIKIGVHPYRVEFSKTLRADEGLSGIAQHRTQVIGIEDILPKSQTDVVFLHEIVHIISRHYNCNIDEADTDRIAQGMAELLFNNLGIEFDWSEIQSG